MRKWASDEVARSTADDRGSGVCWARDGGGRVLTASRLRPIALLTTGRLVDLKLRQTCE